MPDTRTAPPRRDLSSGPKTARDRRLDLIDRIAARAISLGGVLVVLCVIAIIVFVGAGALPLLKGATHTKAVSGQTEAPPEALLALIDEYQERALLVSSTGGAHVLSVDSTVAIAETIDLNLDSARPVAAASDIQNSVLAIGDDHGRLSIFPFEWQVRFTDTGRTVEASLAAPRRAQLSDSTTALVRVAVTSYEGKLRAAALGKDGRLVSYLFDPEWGEEKTVTLERIAGEPAIIAMAIDPRGEKLAVSTDDGRVAVYDVEDGKLVEILPRLATRATALQFLLGGTSLVIGDADGRVMQWLPVKSSVSAGTRFELIREFKRHGAPVTMLAPSRRDKGFVSADESGAWRLNHATSDRTYITAASVGSVAQIAFAPRADGLLAVLHDGSLVRWAIKNEHPEATLRTLFGKVWYEGYQEPKYVWQSTGGSDEFEPKLSLIPLIFGTLKGTFYAMLFSIPISLMAAIYVSQLARPRFRMMVKPIIELMAAIPSVVVGFLAALWLAPMVERHLIGTGLVVGFIPLFAVLAAGLWLFSPKVIRDRIPDGWEPAIALPFIMAGVWLAFQMAPGIENLFFGGNVREWLFVEHGIRYDPRNNVVVGIAMGFAVIPIIFTVSEDALSNVPTALVSGALALGASKWQATWRIALRAASPGIFAAIMLGFGRAVGETMIVLMATGNTPIMDWSVFNGMRTMSAAIAVEIPEAPQGGTLYRVLFLTAFLLFVFTLMVNTVAGMVSSRLRSRYGRF
jgi:phosphate transport system permease protein